MAEFCSIEEQITIACGDEYATSGLGLIYLAPVKSIDESGVTAGGVIHDFSAFALKNSEKWSVLEGKIDTLSYGAESSKDGQGLAYTPTIEGYTPSNDEVKSAALEKLANQRLVAIVKLNVKDSATGNNKAIVIGYDNKRGKGAGAHFTFNPIIEAENGTKNGYDFTLVSNAGESPRFANFGITAEDGSTGESVLFGSAT